MNKTKTLVMLMAAILMTTLGGCNKDDKDSGDLTTGIVGHYSSGSGSGLVDIYVTRINDNTISVALETTSGDVTFANTTMTSSTAFTLNTATTSYPNGGGGTTTNTYTGTGSYSGNIITLIVHQVQTQSQGGTPVEGDDTYNGTRQ